MITAILARKDKDIMMRILQQSETTRGTGDIYIEPLTGIRITSSMKPDIRNSGTTVEIRGLDIKSDSNMAVYSASSLSEAQDIIQHIKTAIENYNMIEICGTELNLDSIHVQIQTIGYQGILVVQLLRFHNMVMMKVLQQSEEYFNQSILPFTYEDFTISKAAWPDLLPNIVFIKGFTPTNNPPYIKFNTENGAITYYTKLTNAFTSLCQRIQQNYESYTIIPKGFDEYYVVGDYIHTESALSTSALVK